MNLGGLNLDLGDLMKQAQQVQERMEQVQRELRNKTVTADAGAGMVTATVSGAQELVSLTVDPSVLADAQVAQDLIVAAVNKALAQARAMAESEMQGLTSMLPKIPGMPF